MVTLDLTNEQSELLHMILDNCIDEYTTYEDELDNIQEILDQLEDFM